MAVAVKVCGMMSEVDIDAAAHAGVDAVGLVLDPAPHRLSLARAEALAAHARARGLEAVAVAGRVGDDEVAQLCDGGRFDVIQVVVTPQLTPRAELLAVFFDSADLLERARRWLARVDPPPQTSGVTLSLAGLVNVDGPSGGGRGVRADWQRAAELARAVPLVLSGGLRPDNVEAAIAAVLPRAVDVCSALEHEPGRKDHAAMAAFVEAVRRAAVASSRGRV
ncbi:MAG: phosphoribosylanthranilate isomerase [Myxococcales bacterium]|nr:phosphoribosylanthranilate isomerase [Myxococcales bacterium]